MNDYERINQVNEEISALIDILTDDEFNFCEEYLKNITSPVAIAVSKALPYEENPNKRGRELLANVNVIKYLDLRRKQVRRAWITKDDVLLNMYDLWIKTKEETQVIDQYGHPTGETKARDLKSATKIAELLAKHFKIIDDNKTDSKKGIDVAPKVSIDKEDLDKFTQEFNAEY